MEMANSDANQNEPAIICIPGQRLCLSDDNTLSGQGTYERHGYIYSAVAGTVNLREEEGTKIIEVEFCGKKTIVPMAGDVVTARVVQINQRMAKCQITAIGDHILNRSYKGILRKEDVRQVEKGTIAMYKCFRVGDIILARVLPQSELTSYQLSTAENELGVVIALASESGPYGVPMVPISWTEMQCPETLVKEPRKVAKVVPESAVAK